MSREGTQKKAETVKHPLSKRVTMTKCETTNLPTVWKNEKFSLTEKIFRENNSLATSMHILN